MTSNRDRSYTLFKTRQIKFYQKKKKKRKKATLGKGVFEPHVAIIRLPQLSIAHFDSSV